MTKSTAELLANGHPEGNVETEKIDTTLQESEERYRRLFEQSPIGIGLSTLDGSIIDSNKTMQAILGYSSEELKKINVANLYQKPEQRRLVLEETKRHGTLSNLSMRLKRKGEASFDALVSVSQVHTRGVILLQTTIQDMSQCRKIEETLRQSEDKYRNLFENARDTILMYDLKGTLSSVNRRAEDYGFRQDQLIGKNIFKFIPKKYRSRLIKELSDMARGNHTEGEIEIITPMGKISVEYRSNPLWEGDKIIGAQTILRDVTERKKAEELVRSSQERLRIIFEYAPDAYYLSDLKGNFVDGNRAAEQITGYNRSELIGKSFLTLKLLPRSEVQRALKLLSRNLLGKPTGPDEFVLNRKDDTQIHVEIRTFPVKIDHKNLVLGIARDVTERKKAEMARRESEEKFKSLFEGSPEAMAHVNLKFEILKINHRFTQLFGYTGQEAEGRNLDNLIVPSDKVDEAEELGKRAIEGHVYHDTMRKTKNGIQILVSLSVAPIVMNGLLTGYVAVFKDISLRKKAEEDLASMNEKLYVISGLTRHDARNRLSLVTTNAYLAKECLAGNDEAKSYLEKIEAAVNDVVGIFDFAKTYEMLGVEKPTYVGVEKAVNEAVALFPALKRVKVVNNCHGVAVLADSLLRQAFYNLIDDSLKYAQNLTQIRVYYERADNDRLKLIYEDNGVGIPFDKKPMLFQKGYTSGKGSGYGLFLIQKMMEIYGWTIREIGEPGRGARFVMDIPKLDNVGKELYRLDARE